MRKMLYILSLFFICSNCFSQSNLLLLGSDENNYYMKSTADSVVLHLVFDTLYTKAHGLDSISYDLSSRKNNLTSNFKVNDYLSYSPLYSNGTSLHFANFNKLFCDSTVSDFYMGYRNFTIEGIIKTSFKSSDDVQRNYWFCKHEPTAPSAGYFCTTTPVNGYSYIKIQDDQGLFNLSYETDKDVCDGKWHYLAITTQRDYPGNKVSLYIDGVYSVRYILDISTLGSVNSRRGQLTVGGLDNRSVDMAHGWFKGEISEVKLTKKALTSIDIANHWNKIKNISITCPTPKTFTAIVNASDNIQLTSAENMADTTLWFKGTEENPTILYKKVCRGASAVDLTVTPGTTYHYRSQNKRIGMNGKPVLSDYSNDIAVTAVENRGERIKSSIDRTFEPSLIYNSNFSADGDGFSAASGSTGVWQGNIDNIYGRNDVLKAYNPGSTTSMIAYKTLVQPGLRYGYSFDYYAPVYLGLTGYLGLRDASQSVYFIQVDMRSNAHEGVWTKAKGNALNPLGAGQTQIRFYLSGSSAGDSLYFKNLSVSQLSNWTPLGNHTIDSSSSELYGNVYSAKITTTGMGDAANNNLSLDTLRFAELKIDSSNTLSVYAKTAAANTTMTLNVGNQTQSFSLNNTWAKYALNFTATSNEVKKKLKIWFSQACIVYLDQVSLK